MGTAKGYTGQYSDPLTGLDYYVSRYYDPVAGIFLSADTKEGNAQGMNPYAYVAQNPETLTDPSGQAVIQPPCCGDPLPPPAPPPPPDHGPTPCPQQDCGNGNSGSSSPTSESKTHKEISLHKACAFICGGIKNPGLFAQGVAAVTAALVIFAASIAGMFYTGGGMWLKVLLAFAKTAVENFGYVVVGMLRGGLQNILDSLQSPTAPGSALALMCFK